MARGSSRAASRQVNTSSETVFDALTILSRTDRPLGVADFHRLLDEPTSSIHRALMTLEETGYGARYQGNAKYVPGPMCHNLVRALVNRYPIRGHARPFMRRIMDVVDGATTLHVRLGWYALRVGSIESRGDFQEGRRVGEARPLHEPVAPLTILSFLDDSEIERYRAWSITRAGTPFPPLPEIAETRARGWLVGEDPDRPGQTWVNLPLRHAGGATVAAIGVSLPARLIAENGPEWREVLATVASLQRGLAEDPAAAAVPFGHLDPDAIVLPD